MRLPRRTRQTPRDRLTSALSSSMPWNRVTTIEPRFSLSDSAHADSWRLSALFNIGVVQLETADQRRNRVDAFGLVWTGVAARLRPSAVVAVLDRASRAPPALAIGTGDADNRAAEAA